MLAATVIVRAFVHVRKENCCEACFLNTETRDEGNANINYQNKRSEFLALLEVTSFEKYYTFEHVEATQRFD